MISYEPDEDETVNASCIKKAFKDLMDSLSGSSGQSVKTELATLKHQDSLIKRPEKQLKDTKAQQKALSEALEHKLQLKRLGGNHFKQESLHRIQQIDAKLAELNEPVKDDKKKIADDAI